MHIFLLICMVVLALGVVYVVACYGYVRHLIISEMVHTPREVQEQFPHLVPHRAFAHVQSHGQWLVRLLTPFMMLWKWSRK